MFTTNKAPDRHRVRRLLVLLDEQVSYLGDCCLRFDKIKKCRSFFPHAVIDINYNNRKYIGRYNALLKHNPYVDNIGNLDWKDIDFYRYDLVICVMPNEDALRAALHEKYAADGGEAPVGRIFSLSEALLHPERSGKAAFPVYDALLTDTGAAAGNEPGELYISEQEKQWANGWLKKNGVEPGECVGVFLDTASTAEKTIRTDVYFDLLTSFLDKGKCKALIFDEKGIGKKAFYTEWLGATLASKLIFAERHNLREDLCLLASDHIRLIFGPCTGIMHCASGIYNNFVAKGMAAADAPAMIVYTGVYNNRYDTARFWWENAPLVDCLVLGEVNGRVEMTLLDTLTGEAEQATNILSCKRYTAAMLTGFMQARCFGDKANSCAAG